MATFLQDLRYGFRVLLKSPGFAVVAVLTLALGIGANTSIFSVINAVLLRNLPVREPERLAIVGDPSRVHAISNGSPRADIFSVPLYHELQRHQDAFDGLAATGYLGPTSMFSLEEGGQLSTPEKVNARLVSGNFFSVLGVDAVLGRVFRSDNDTRGSDPIAVISYGFWRRRFHQDPAAIGRTIRMNGYPLTVVGITPPEFTGEAVGDAVDLWIPLSMQPLVMPGYEWLENLHTSFLELFGRLKPGLTINQARSRMLVTYDRVATSAFAAQFNHDDRQQLRTSKLEVSSGARGLSSVRPHFQGPLQVLMAIVGLVLLIACVNVANLMLARSASRRKEIAVRVAIGGSPARIVRQLLTESVLLAFVGGACGLLLAQWGTRALLALLSSRSVVPLEAAPDVRVLIFTALVCVFAGILFGLAPALRAQRIELTPALNSAAREQSAAGSPARWTLGRLLVAVQVSLSILVLFAAGLLVQSLRNLRAVDTGYERHHLVMVRLDPRSAGYKEGTYVPFCEDLLRRIRALPGVTSATYSKNGLFSGNESIDEIVVPGFAARSDEDNIAYNDSVGPNFFTAIGIPLVMGRDVAPQDVGQPTPKVAVVNESFARFYFGEQNPIGRTFKFEDPDNPNIEMQIVGVSRDVHDNDLRLVRRRFYVPVNQVYLPGDEVNYEVRAGGDPAAVEQGIRAAVQAANPQVAILRMQTVADLVDDSMPAEIFVARLSGFFAALALLLACVGLYGITSYAVAGRTREIGVRIALGAHPSAVLWLVLREALLLVGVGVIVGVPAAIAASRLLQSLLYGVSVLDPGALGASLLLLAGVALLSAWLPARRATRIDPMLALRYE